MRRVSFPARRLRRLRRTPALRRLVAEAAVSVDDVVAPLFVREGIDAPEPIASMPGVVQHTRESLRKEARELADLGLPAVILFGIPEHKDATGSGAYDPDGIVQVALRDLRDEVGESLVLIAMVMIGGLGSLSGAFLGAFVVIGLPKLIQLDNPWIVPIGSGILLLLVIVRARGGIAGVVQAAREKLVVALDEMARQPVPPSGAAAPGA